MPRFRASEPTGLFGLIAAFLLSRGGLCVLAVGLAVAARLSIPKSMRWFEPVVAIAMIMLWPRIELMVHRWMHS